MEVRPRKFDVKWLKSYYKYFSRNSTVDVDPTSCTRDGPTKSIAGDNLEYPDRGRKFPRKILKSANQEI